METKKVCQKLKTDSFLIHKNDKQIYFQHTFFYVPIKFHFILYLASFTIGNYQTTEDSLFLSYFITTLHRQEFDAFPGTNN